MGINQNEFEQSAPMTPPELHRAAFSEKSQMDMARLSLSQSKFAADQSAKIEQAQIQRARFANQIQQNISSAAAAHKLLQLDPSSKSFEKDTNGILNDHPEALNSTGFQKFLSERRADRASYVKSETPDVITNPYAAKTFESTYQATGNPQLAANAAKGQLALFDKATKLAASPHLSPEDVSKFYNPQTGEYNLDPAAINQAEIKHSTAEQAAKFTNESKTTHDEALKFLTTLNKSAPLDTTQFPAAGKAAADRTPAEQAANNAAWNAFKQLTGGAQPTTPAPATGTKPGDFKQILDGLLGSKPTASAEAAAPTVAANEPPPEDDLPPGATGFGSGAAAGAKPFIPVPTPTPSATPAAKLASGIPGGDELAEKNAA